MRASDDEEVMAEEYRRYHACCRERLDSLLDQATLSLSPIERVCSLPISSLGRGVAYRCLNDFASNAHCDDGTHRQSEAPGYVTPDDEHEGRGEAIRKAAS